MSKELSTKTYKELFNDQAQRLIENFGVFHFPPLRLKRIFEALEQSKIEMSWFERFVDRMIDENNAKLNPVDGIRGEIRSRRQSEESRMLQFATKQITDGKLDEILKNCGSHSLWDVIKKTKEDK